jgi:hypothetical protein
MARDDDADQRAVRKALKNRPPEPVPKGFSTRLSARLAQEKAVPSQKRSIAKKKNGAKKKSLKKK